MGWLTRWALANPLDLLRPEALRDGETGRVEVPHRRLVGAPTLNIAEAEE